MVKESKIDFLGKWFIDKKEKEAAYILVILGMGIGFLFVGILTTIFGFLGDAILASVGGSFTAMGIMTLYISIHSLNKLKK